MVTNVSDSNANMSLAVAQYANAQPERFSAPAPQNKPAKTTDMLPVPVVQERSPQRTTASPPTETTGISTVFEMNPAEANQSSMQGAVGIAMEQYTANSTAASPYAFNTLDIYA